MLALHEMGLFKASIHTRTKLLDVCARLARVEGFLVDLFSICSDNNVGSNIL